MKYAYICTNTGLELVDCNKFDRTIKVSIRKVYLNRYGYDSDGTYFGHGQPLYHVHGENDGYYIDEYVRAFDRRLACEQIQAYYGSAVKFKIA